MQHRATSETPSGNSKTCYFRSIGRSLNSPQNMNCKYFDDDDDDDDDDNDNNNSNNTR